MPECQLRYQVKRSRVISKYYILDTRRSRMVTRNFGVDPTYYDTHSGAQTVCDALNKEDMSMYEDTGTHQTQFSISWRRPSPGGGYVPMPMGVRRTYHNDRQGAQSALQDYLDARSGDKTGDYLVHCSHGAWTFKVKPPEPRPLVIEAI